MNGDIYAGRRDAPIPWPSRSTDLTPLGFFLGQKEIQNLMHLRKGVTIVIKKCIGRVTPEMYSTCEVKTSIIFKSVTARQRTNGAHIEQRRIVF